MLDFLINTAELAAVVLLVLGVFFVSQFVIERFILITLPVIMELWVRIRDSEKYQDK